MSFEEQYQKKHKRLSLIKSYIRIVSCLILIVDIILWSFVPWQFTSALGICGMFYTIMALMFPVGFLIAEMIGIAEENI